MQSTVDQNLEDAISSMLENFPGNKWLSEVCWPENEERVRLMVSDIAARHPPGPEVRILDVGCFNGYVSLVFAGLGYQVRATDACKLDDRKRAFDAAEIEFFYSNLNEPDALANVNDASIDVVIMGEVLEHVLNHPLGLLREVARVLRNNGLLVLTTPNPATLMNVLRLLTDRWTLWGTREFMELPKINGSQIICKEDIHYREYRSSDVIHLLESAGFELEKLRYMGMGISTDQPILKRLAKGNAIARSLMSRRLFACTHYFLARKIN